MPHAELAGLAALAALLLLPGLLIVRAPWTAVPFLSASFWIVSWWWLPHLGAARTRFLHASLVAFAILALLRLARPGASAPTWPTILVLAAALARLVPFWLWPVGPGADMSLHSLSTLLLVWRDGIPATYEPLLPIRTFGAYTPGLHGLAADVTLLSGLPAHRSTFLVSVAAYGLLQVALFALLSRLFRPRVAALASLFALGMARGPQAFFGWGGNPSVLALAFLVAAAALLARGAGASAAAGAFLGAAAVTHTMMAAVAGFCAPLAFEPLRRAPSEERARLLRRYVLAASASLLAAGPYLLQLDFTLSAGERAWLADHLRARYAADWARYSELYAVAVLRYTVAALNDAFLWAALVGAAIAVRRRHPTLGATSLAFALLVALAASSRWGGLGSLVVFPERAMAVGFVVLAAWVGFLVEALDARRGALGGLALLVLAGVAVERTHRYYVSASVGVMVSAHDLEAMEWIRTHTAPLDVVCNDYPTAGLWIPALAGRAISSPQLPPFYFDEFRAGARPCTYRYVARRWFFGPPLSPRPAEGPIGFANASVTVVGPLTTFDTAPRNPAPREP